MPKDMRCYVGTCNAQLKPKSKDGTAWWCPKCDSYIKVTKAYAAKYFNVDNKGDKPADA